MHAIATDRPVLIIVEGVNDIEFLKRLSTRLHLECDKVVDLAQLQAQGRILFVPTGGGNFSEWAVRFRSLACREFHLYDRESTPETEHREFAVELVNGRSDCRGFVTAKRSLENYLHPWTIAQASGGDIVVRDDECVGTVLARHWYEMIPQRKPWSQLSRRAARRWVYRAKRWLNRQAVEQMTLSLLNERDQGGEVLQWLEVIGGMTRDGS